VQRLIVSQINQSNGGDPIDSYGGELNYNVAPWVDWGPYMWASGDAPRSDGLVWCNNSNTAQCSGVFDVRYGDPNDQTDYFGDFTHPTAMGESKAAGQLVKWITDGFGDTQHQHYISDWIYPWIEP
jgi:hypothetical protein